LCGAVRSFSHVQLAAGEGWLDKLVFPMKMAGVMPLFVKWGKLTLKDLSEQFTNPFLRESFSKMWYPQMSAMGLLFTLAMLTNKGAGYTLGGSLPMALAVEKRYRSLGGEMHYDSRIRRILVENDRACGVVLEDGQVERADVVISGADGYNTIFKMLDGRYIDDEIKEQYSGKQPIFEPIVFVGLGVKRTFDELPKCTAGISYPLEKPFQVGEQTVDRLEGMFYNFDPSLAPEGKSVVTVMINSTYDYWKDLYGDGSNREQYDAEKQRIAMEIIHGFEKQFPGFEDQVEMADVATPLTFEHYTGNWQGSFEGWLPTPQAMRKPIAKTLPGLEDFYMVGQWVQAGGGLPSGVMTGREVIQKMCKADGKKFTARV
jgi:phytoene dehydrogenase-like protein